MKNVDGFGRRECQWVPHPGAESPNTPQTRRQWKLKFKLLKLQYLSFDFPHLNLLDRLHSKVISLKPAVQGWLLTVQMSEGVRVDMIRPLQP